MIDQEDSLNFTYFFLALGFIVLINPQNLPVPDFTMIEMRTQNYGAVCISENADTIVSANDGVHIFRPNELNAILRDVELSFDGRKAAQTAALVARTAAELSRLEIGALVLRMRNRFTIVRQRILSRDKIMLGRAFASKMARNNLKGVHWHKEFWALVKEKYASISRETKDRQTVEDLGEEETLLERGQAFPSCVTITDDGNIAITAGRDGRVKAWSLTPNEKTKKLEGRELIPYGIKAGEVHYDHMRPFCSVALSGALDGCRTLMLAFEVGDASASSSGVQLWHVDGLLSKHGNSDLARVRVLNQAQSKAFDIFDGTSAVSNAVGKAGISIAPSGKVGVTGHFSGWIVIWGFHWHQLAHRRQRGNLSRAGHYTIQVLRKWCHESPVQSVRLHAERRQGESSADDAEESLRLFTVEPLIDLVCVYRVVLKNVTKRRRRSLSATTVQALLRSEGDALETTLMRSFSGHAQRMTMSLSDVAPMRKDGSFIFGFSTSNAGRRCSHGVNLWYMGCPDTRKDDSSAIRSAQQHRMQPLISRKFPFQAASAWDPCALTKTQLLSCAIMIARRLKVKGTRYRFKRRRYMNCFKGSSMVSALVRAKIVADKHAAVLLGTRMAKLSIIQCVSPAKGLRDDGNDWLFRKMQRVDVTSIAKDALRENFIPSEFASQLRQGFECREIVRSSKSNHMRSACQGMQLLLHCVVDEEGEGSTTKWMLLKRPDVTIVGCKKCRALLKGANLVALVQSLKVYSRRIVREEEEKSALKRASDLLESRTWDPHALEDFLENRDTMIRYVESYIATNNIDEDPKYARKLDGNSVGFRRFHTGPIGAFDVIRRAVRTKLGQRLSKPKGLHEHVVADADDQASDQIMTPTLIGEAWWNLQLDRRGVDGKATFDRNVEPWRVDVIKRIGTTVRARRSLKRVLKQSSMKHTISRLPEWVHPAVQRPHKVLWRYLLVLVAVVLWLKLFAQLRAVRTCDGKIMKDPLFMPDASDESVYPYYDGNDACIATDARSYQEQACPHEVSIFQEYEDASDSGLFVKAKSTGDGTRNDINLDVGQWTFLVSAISDLVLMFLLLFHLNIVQTEGLWNSLDSKGWKFIRKQLDHREDKIEDSSSTFLSCWNMLRVIVNIVVHKFRQLLKDTVVQLWDSVRQSHLKPGEDFFGVTMMVHIFLFFVILFTQASLTTTLTENYIEAAYVTKIVVALAIGYIDRVAYVRRTIVLKFVLHVSCLLMYYAWWKAELRKGSISQILLALLCILYLLLSSLQICYGYPSISQFGVISGPDIAENYYNKRLEIYGWIFRIYRLFPFLPEIAAVLDWACTDTTLLIGDWMRTADIYARLFDAEISFDFFILMDREKGQPQKLWRKIVQGGLLSLILFIVLIFPLIVFSEFNPTNEDSLVTRGVIDIGFYRHGSLYVQSANVSLPLVTSSDSNSEESCPYSDTIAEVSGEDDRYWYDQQYCFVEPTFDFSCMLLDDSNYYNYWSSISGDEAFQWQSSQFIFFPDDASQNLWDISLLERNLLVQRLRSPSETMIIDVKLAMERSNYDSADEDVMIRNQVTLTEDQKQDFLHLLTDSENRSTSFVRVENVLPPMIYLGTDSGVSYPEYLDKNSERWLDCDFWYFSNIDLFASLISSSEISAGAESCESGNSEGQSCSFSMITPWSEVIVVNGTCAMSAENGMICNSTSGRSTMQYIRDTSAGMFKFEDYWQVSCFYRNPHEKFATDVWFGKPYGEQGNSTASIVNECFRETCSSNETECFDHVGPFFFVSSAPYVFLLQYLSSSSIVGLYVVFVFTVSQFVRGILRGGRHDIIYQYMPYARNLSRIVETMDMARSMSMVSVDKRNKKDFLELEDELFSELVNKYRRPEELYRITGEFRHWFLADSNDIRSNQVETIQHREERRSAILRRRAARRDARQ
eukprot:g2253.t1